jgi:hypothetical protein
MVEEFSRSVGSTASIGITYDYDEPISFIFVMCGESFVIRCAQKTIGHHICK